MRYEEDIRLRWTLILVALGVFTGLAVSFQRSGATVFVAFVVSLPVAIGVAAGWYAVSPYRSTGSAEEAWKENPLVSETSLTDASIEYWLRELLGDAMTKLRLPIAEQLVTLADRSKIRDIASWAAFSRDKPRSLTLHDQLIFRIFIRRAETHLVEGRYRSARSAIAIVREVSSNQIWRITSNYRLWFERVDDVLILIGKSDFEASVVRLRQEILVDRNAEKDLLRSESFANPTDRQLHR